MQRFEYKVVVAPARSEKIRGTKDPAERFALTVGTLLNDLGRDGWEYVRADTLPCEERTGFTKRTTVFHALLVFRRASDVALAGDAPRLLGSDVAGGRAPGLVAAPRDEIPARPQRALEAEPATSAGAPEGKPTAPSP